MTNAWSLQRRQCLVLCCDEMFASPVPFHCFQHLCLRIHHFQGAVAGFLSPDGCRIDVCVGVSHFSFLDSGYRGIGNSEAQHISSKGWHWKWGDRMIESWKSLRLRDWNEVKEGQEEDSREGTNYTMTRCTRHQLDLFQLLFSPHEETCINSDTHTFNECFFM